MPVAFATSIAAAQFRIRSVSSLSISSTRLLSGFKGNKSLIVVLVAQCVVLPVGPHTKLNHGLKTKNATA